MSARGSLVNCLHCNVVFRIMLPLIVYSMYLTHNCLVPTSLESKITLEGVFPMDFNLA